MGDTFLDKPVLLPEQLPQEDCDLLIITAGDIVAADTEAHARTAADAVKVDIELHYLQTYRPNGPYGAAGCGEAPPDVPHPAILNAILIPALGSPAFPCCPRSSWLPWLS